MQCGPNDSDVRAYVCDMPKRVKHLNPTTSFDEMRQKWIQYAKNTATPSYAIMQHTRSLANQQFEVNELRRRINASDIEREPLIASKYGNTLYFTPPYHPELQPIELVWGMVKNRVAICPSKNVAELEERLWSLFGEVKSHHWVSSYRKAEAYEDIYEALDEDVVLVSSGSSIGSD
ncbi:hypothetical protein H257_01833 [Aphanomyces astaci]|uniref:Tc1-like transposase DDE domain-containing protein n=1 Tax=Aphanomyces astaci TaxID=112090 RepID=W4H564_APHAT|nr:hypothetical protein H257_01833 [Aphanomyces astaci]ETV86741.1 hypothetical protein H257_01833 [Aphanomyces astaci]|eukprot:XP_009823540.1 hypothetical protein H257_01833 [Aphanomyces astaci]